MQKVLTAAEMREVDRLTTERYGIPSILLMENAAHAVARVITEKLGGSVEGKQVLILCGPGNNGGDGAALARILSSQGCMVYVTLFGTVDKAKDDAKVNFGIAKEMAANSHLLTFEEVSIVQEEASNWWSEFISRFAITRIDCVVDSIFGTGFHGKIESPLGPILETLWTNLNRRFHEIVLISVDLPSGLDADQPDPQGWHFFPDVTVTFTAPKVANVLPAASRYNGELIVANIGSPSRLIDEQASKFFLAEKRDALIWLNKSSFGSSSYKNKRGHALIIAGSRNYTGAAVLAGDAAIRSGCGLVTIATPESSRESIVARVSPEVMVRGIDETSEGSAAVSAIEQVDEFRENVDVIAIGSGLSSKEDETKTFVEKIVTERKTPVIIDADGLTALSPWAPSPAYAGRGEGNTAGRDAGGTPALQVPLILTPHEGEFRKLLGVKKEEAEEILKDRVEAVKKFATENQVFLVLKGERNLIASPDGRVVVNPTGNSGLGKAGNGDTLTGIIAGFVAQAVQMKIDMLETIVAAVYIAGLAGDVAEKKYGKRVMTASDVRECLVDVFCELNAGPSGSVHE